MNLYSYYLCDFVLFCLVSVVSMYFLPAIQYTKGESGMGPAPVFNLFFIFIYRQLTPRDAPPCVCLPLSLFNLISVPLSLLLHLISLYGALVFLVFLPELSCTAHMVAFLALRVLYVVVLGLFRFCFLAFLPESLPGDDVLCSLLSRPLSSVCFLPCLVVLFCFAFPTVFAPDLF